MPPQPIAGLDGLSPELAAAVRKMISDAAAQGTNVYIESGFRTYDQQVALVQKHGLYGQGGLAAAPGTSNHEVGMAVDFGGDLTWVHNNAHRYGIHFPVPGEPWHAELAGGRGTPQAGVGPSGELPDGENYIDQLAEGYDPTTGWVDTEITWDDLAPEDKVYHVMNSVLSLFQSPSNDGTSPVGMGYQGNPLLDADVTLGASHDSENLPDVLDQDIGTL
jgi:hypothetical protein